MGIGDWGLGIGPNPQSPIPNPQSPIPNYFIIIYIIKLQIFFENKLYINFLKKLNYSFKNDR